MLSAGATGSMLFQSHLYGIESDRVRCSWKSSASFNRTFMELKAEIDSNSSIWNVFQSHLYGIESADEPDERVPRRVSIAPLWNWKWGVLFLPTRQRFVSIAPLWNWKILLDYEQETNINVSIAPLWNWKWNISEAFNEDESFNRTFMELKGPKRVRIIILWWVSIAPLWNWKSGRAAISANSASFNRTFMELKAWISK